MKEGNEGDAASGLESRKRAPGSGAAGAASGGRPLGHGRADTTSGSGHALSHVTLRIHEVKCERTTKEIDQDEIELVAIKTCAKVEGTGKGGVAVASEEDRRIAVGKFKKDVAKTYSPPQSIAQFPVGDESAAWPRCYLATLLLIEKDEGAVGTIVNATIDAIDKQVKVAVVGLAKAAAGTILNAAGIGAAAGSVVPLAGPVIFGAVAAGVGLALEGIKKARADDSFPPERVRLVLDAAPTIKGEVAESRGVAKFDAFRGVYKVVYSWSVG